MGEDIKDGVRAAVELEVVRAQIRELHDRVIALEYDASRFNKILEAFVEATEDDP